MQQLLYKLEDFSNTKISQFPLKNNFLSIVENEINTAIITEMNLSHSSIIAYLPQIVEWSSLYFQRFLAIQPKSDIEPQLNIVIQKSSEINNQDFFYIKLTYLSLFPHIKIFHKIWGEDTDSKLNV